MAIVLPIVGVGLIVGAVFAFKYCKKKMTEQQQQPVNESEAVSFPVQQQPASAAYDYPGSTTDPLMSPPPQAAPLAEEVPSTKPTAEVPVVPVVPVVPAPGVASTEEEIEVVVPVVPTVPTTNNQTESLEATTVGKKSAQERLEELDRIKDLIGEESYNAKKAEILESI